MVGYDENGTLNLLFEATTEQVVFTEHGFELSDAGTHVEVLWDYYKRQYRQVTSSAEQAYKKEWRLR